MKRYRKNVCGIAFAITLCFLLCIMPVAAATPTLNAELKPSADKKTVTVIFSIENNPGIADFKFVMNYDNKILKPTKTAIGSKVTGGSFADNLKNAATALTVLWVSGGSNYTGNGELCSATFSVIGTVTDGKYPITITYDPTEFINQDYKVVKFEVKGMTASTPTFSAQSAQSKTTSSTSTGSQAQSSFSASASSAVSSTSSPSSIGTGSPQIEVNSQIRPPDYVSSASVIGSTSSLSNQTASGETQSNSQENSRIQSTGATGTSSLPIDIQSTQSEITEQTTGEKLPVFLIIAVLCVAVASAIIFIVLLIKKRKPL